MSIATRPTPLDALPDREIDVERRRPALQRSSAWAAVAAAVTAAGVSRPTLGTVDAAVAGASAMALVALVFARRRRDGGADPDRALAVALGVAAGAVVAAGAYAGRAHLPTVGPVAQVIVGWFVVGLLLLPEQGVQRAAGWMDDPVDDSPDESTWELDRLDWDSAAMPRRPDQRRLAIIAACGLVVIAAVALLLSTAVSTAALLGAALPLALILLVAVERALPVSRTAGVSAVAAGALAGGIALSDRTDPVGAAVVALVLVVTVYAAAVLAAFRTTRLPRWLATGGLVLALLALGAAPGVVIVAGLGAGLASELRRARPPAAAATDDALPSTTLRTRTIVTSLTAAAFVARILAPRGLWLDETTSVHQARLPFTDMLQLIYAEDNHPPLHHVLLWLDIRLVGDSELALRLPSVIIGSLLVPMLYVAGTELFNRRAGLVAAAIGAIAPVAVWYGQEARMYAQFMLLALIVVWAQVRILRTGQFRYWAVLTACCTALIYSQYFASLHVGAVFLVFVIEAVRRRHSGRAWQLIRQAATALVVMLVAVAPLVPFALHQAIHNQQAGFGFSSTGVATGSAVVPQPGIYGLLSNVQWAFWGYQPDSVATRIVALWPVGLLLLLVLLGQQRRSANRYLLLVAGLPVGIVFAASFFAAKSRSLAEIRYFAGAVPLVFLLVGGAIATAIRSRRVRAAVIGGLLASMALALGVQETSAENPRLYQYREAIAEVATLARAGDQLVYSPAYLNYVLEYYNPGIPSLPLVDGLPRDPPGRIFLVTGKSFADSDLANVAVTDALAELAAQGMHQTATYEYAQITVLVVGATSEVKDPS